MGYLNNYSNCNNNDNCYLEFTLEYIYLSVLIGGLFYLTMNQQMKKIWKFLGQLLLIALIGISVYSLINHRLNEDLVNPDDTFHQEIYGKGNSYFPIVNNLKIHIRCYNSNSLDQSTNNRNKTILFEAGLPFYSTIWGNVLRDIQNNTIIQSDIKQYCVYDRYGYGWSDFNPSETNGLKMVSDLKQYLEQLNITSNIVLVGWSYGGILSQLFTTQYSNMIDGLVLVDSMDVKDLEDPTLKSLLTQGIHSFNILKYILFTGIVDLPISFPIASGYFSNVTLPEDMIYTTDVFYSNYPTLQTSIQELSVVMTSLNQMNDTMNTFKDPQHFLGNLPLVVLTAGLNTSPNWIQRQNQIANFSTNSVHIINNQTDHFIPIEASNSIINAIQLCLLLNK